MLYILLCYLIAINMLAMIITVKDKRAAKRNRRRTPEATLMSIGALGGALMMLITMKRIRHKTQKPKFMIGLPLLLILHIAVVTLLVMSEQGCLTI